MIIELKFDDITVQIIHSVAMHPDHGSVNVRFSGLQDYSESDIQRLIDFRDRFVADNIVCGRVALEHGEFSDIEFLRRTKGRGVLHVRIDDIPGACGKQMAA
jgi:hypothetical protein